MSNYTKYIIGKADKMYTLWYEETFTQNGRTRTKVSFIKNLSKSLDIAKAMYPAATVDETLRGNKWIVNDTPKYEEPKSIDPTKFPFGKYTGTNVADCTDIDYMVWFYGEVKFKCKNETMPSGYDELLTNIEKRAATYNYFPWNNDLLTKEDYDAHRTAPRRYNAFKKAMLETHTIEGVMETNPSPYNPTVFEFKGFKVYVNFREDQLAEYMYKGFPYYLPLVDGKSKRVKGKNVRITFKNLQFNNRNDVTDIYYGYANVEYVSLEII